MKHLSHKTMSVIAWMIVALQALIMLLSYLNYGAYSALAIVLSLLAIILQIFIALTMKNENAPQKRIFTLSVIFCVLDLSLPSVLLLAMILIKRYAKRAEIASKLRMIPCFAAAVIGGIKVGTSFAYSGAPFTLILSLAATLLQYYVIGYWCFNNAAERSARDDYKAAVNRNSQLAYYNDLYQQGAISAEEWAQIQDKFNK